jgi:hypothetical protein
MKYTDCIPVIRVIRNNLKIHQINNALLYCFLASFYIIGLFVEDLSFQFPIKLCALILSDLNGRNIKYDYGRR